VASLVVALYVESPDGLATMAFREEETPDPREVERYGGLVTCW